MVSEVPTGMWNDRILATQKKLKNDSFRLN